MLKKHINKSVKLLHKSLFTFCKKKRVETFIYIMNDKHSVKPEKEYRVIHESKYEIDELSKTEKRKLISYEKYKVSEKRSIISKMIDSINLIQNKVFKIFLPRDYPYSVKEGYSGFSKYVFITNICFNVMNFLSTQVLINSLGFNISDTKKYAFSAGLNWVIKDGVGQVGSIFFAAKYSHNIERNLKEWRMKANIISNAAILMEISTVISPQNFLLIASIANILKLAGMTVFGVTRAGIIQHFAINNNVIDITNKSTTQHNLSVLLGNLLGFMISYFVPLGTYSTFGIVGCLTAYNLITSKKSVDRIILDDFSPQRMYYFCEEYINNKHILTPQDINIKDRIVFNKLKSLYFSEFSLDYVIKKENNSEYLIELFDIFHDKKFFCYVKKYWSFRDMKIDYMIFICLRVDSDNQDIFIAFLFAIRLKFLLMDNYKVNMIIEILKDNMNYIEKIERKSFFDEIKLKGWSLNFSILEEKYCRYHILYK